MSLSGEGDEVEVAVVPQILICVRKKQDTLRIQGRDRTGIVGDENDGPLIVAQSGKDLLARCWIEVVGWLVEQQDVGARCLLYTSDAADD